MLGRLRKLAAPLERRTLASPEVGASTSVFCAISPDAVPGGYHLPVRAGRPVARCRRCRAGTRLWDTTSEWVAQQRASM